MLERNGIYYSGKTEKIKILSRRPIGRFQRPWVPNATHKCLGDIRKPW